MKPYSQTVLIDRQRSVDRQQSQFFRQRKADVFFPDDDAFHFCSEAFDQCIDAFLHDDFGSAGSRRDQNGVVSRQRIFGQFVDAVDQKCFGSVRRSEFHQTSTV